MKILVINGSPRDNGSNTMILTNAFLKGTGYTNIDVVSVAKSNIKGCIGCFSCWAKTPGKCVIKDDMRDILNKIIEADVVVWSFPLYYFSLPGDLKNLIDRQLPLALPEMEQGAENGDHPSRYDFSKQRHIAISTCGFWTDKGNYDSVYAMYNRLHGGEGNYSTIFVGQGPILPIANMKEIPEEYVEVKSIIDNFLSVVEKAGKEFANGKIEADTLKAISQPLIPKEAYEQSANASW